MKILNKLSGLLGTYKKAGIYALLLVGTTTITAQTYTFTTGGASGANGPSQGALNTAYLLTSLNGSVVANAGIQSFTIPATGLYRIEARGASGGNRSASTQVGGLGVSMAGSFNLVQGDVLRILVGQKGVDGTNTGSGAGGSFVQRNGTIILAAGGGGGATGDNSAANATTLTAGTVDFPGGTIPGGTGGFGGGVCNSGGTNHGGGGGGYVGDGATSSLGTPGGGGLSFTNGGTGGASALPGAFGGGGGATNAGAALYGGGGGGGGYSGGAGGQQVNYCTPGINRSGGGGGGSYNAGINQVNSVLSAQGDGTVIITALCNININTPVNPMCIGQTITLNTDAVSGISWSSGSTSNAITVSPTITTTYSVTGTSTANCVAGTVITITVSPLPTINAIVSPSLLCVGSQATLTASGANTYTWSSGTVAQSANVSPLVTTVYTVTATSIYGCVSSNTLSTLVNSNTLTVASGLNLCKGKSVNLTASGAVSYTWSTGYRFPSLPITPTANIDYSLVAVDANGCQFSKVVSVTVVDPPPVLASVPSSTVCKGADVIITASGASSYTWNTGVTGAVLNVTLPIDIAYSYSVTGTDAATGCTHLSSVTIFVSKCLGVAEIGLSALSVGIMPNPGNGLFVVKVDDLLPQMNMDVYNELGMLVKTQQIVSTESKLDIQGEKAGIYFVRISSGEGRQKVMKVIKE